MQTNRNWGMVCGGIALVIIGFILLFVPGITLVTIAVVAGIGLLVIGIINIISYFAMRSTANLSGWALAYGIGDVILGVIFLFHPLVTAVVIPWLVGIFIIAYGVFSIVIAWSLRGVRGAGWMWFNAIYSILCGLCFIIWPEIFAYVLAFFLMFRGVSLGVYGASGEDVPPSMPTYGAFRP